MSNVNIKFENFSPKKDFENYLIAELKIVECISPSDSSLNLFLNNKNNSWIGELKVTSSNKSFSSTAIGDCEAKVSTQLFQDIKAKLKKWAHTKQII